jgi:acyl-CoA reductase-like NAD-dependent aldehyde dehydrogenase
MPDATMRSLVEQSSLLIDGKLVPAEGGRTFTSINPATEEPIGESPDATVGDAERAVEAARRAFDESTWATDRDFRVHCLRQFVAALREHVEPMRALTIAEVGVPVSLTTGPALEAAIDVLEYYADLASTYELTHELPVAMTRGTMQRRTIEREAYGVVSAISAYNYPNQLNLAKLAPALAAGCTVVLKGAPDTPLVTQALGRLIAEHTDMPPGVVNIISSSEPAVGAALTTLAGVDMITFTGSTEIGRAIMAAASPTLKKCFLELGGKSAYIVLDDGVVPMASMYCSFAVGSHAGQGCAIPTRLVVPRASLDDAVNHVVSTFQAMKVGDPADPSNYMGPLISAKQRDRVQGHVDRAVADGARVAVGGGRPPELERGYFFQPTLIVGADENSAIAQDEVFGPVMVILPHDGDDDAVRIANNSIFGLSAAVHASDRERALGVARRLRTGTVGINGGNFNTPDAPFGGYKQSGFGREMGVAGLEEFLQTKVIAEPAPQA